MDSIIDTVDGKSRDTVSSPDIFHCFGLGTYTVLPSLTVHALYLTFMFASVAVTIST